MKKSLHAILSLIFMQTAFTSPSQAKAKHNQTKIVYAAQYQIESLAPNLHLYLITTTVKNPTGKASIDFILPAWRPGRYQIQNYAANVQEFSAKSGTTSLVVEKQDKQTWRVSTDGASEVTVQYKYYAGAQLDAGNSYVGRDEIYFNGSNLFVYTEETRFQPVSLFINYPDGWKVATQLERTSNPKLFTAESYDELIDAPTVVSPTLVEVSTKVKGATIKIYFHNNDALGGTKFNPKQIAADIAKIVEAQFDLYDEVPFKEYVFIYHIQPYQYTHGVEHKNSCSIVMGPVSKINDNYDGFLSITSHEFYHVWNIKRIKPKEFMPYDYTKESYTPMLYVSEGFTSYYGDIALIRSKVWTASNYVLSEIGKNITIMQNTYGRKIQPVAMSSFDAWLSGYGVGRANSTVNFYGKGELIGMILDLEIRHRTKNKSSLDNVMKSLNEEFAHKQKGFTATDFQQIVEQVSGSSFKTFFENYVFGTEELPYETVLAYAGLDLKKVQAKSPVFGVSTTTENDMPIISSLVPESPASMAGLDNGDMIIAINNQSLIKETLSNVINKFTSGDTIKVSILRDKKLVEMPVRLSSKDDFIVQKKSSPTKSQKEILESWLNAKWEDI